MKKQRAIFGTTEICGVTYPIIGAVEVRDKLSNTSMYIPIPAVKMQSDYDWQEMCLNDRLENPEKYIGVDNDVNETIERLKKWLEDHRKDETA